MTTYIAHGVTLSEGQRKKLANAINENSEITLRISHNALSGPDEMMLTQTQINKIHKAASAGKGVDLKISKTQIPKIAQEGGSLFSSLAALAAKVLPKVVPTATKVLSKVTPGLATGALTSIGNFVTDKILGGFLIPNSKIQELIAYKDLLTTKQKKDIYNALQSGGDLKIKPTKKQQLGGFLGTLLASLAAPVVLKWLTGSGVKSTGGATGKGLQNRPSGRTGRGGALQNRPYWEGAPPPIYFPPQFDGPVTTVGRGQKKQKGEGILLGENSPFNGIPIIGDIF